MGYTEAEGFGVEQYTSVKVYIYMYWASMRERKRSQWD